MDKKLLISLWLIFALLESIVLAFNVQEVKAFDYISIEPNGQVLGTDKIAKLNDTVYVFTDDLANSTVRVHRSNIIIDGAGHTLGPGASDIAGIEVDSLSNVTIKNIKIEDFGAGIWIHASSHIVISGNSIAKSVYGLSLICQTIMYFPRIT